MAMTPDQSAMLLGEPSSAPGGAPPAMGGGGMAPEEGGPDAIMQTFMQLDQFFSAIAQEVPAAAEEARLIQSALKQMLAKMVASQPQGAAAPAPAYS